MVIAMNEKAFATGTVELNRCGGKGANFTVD
jgi:hypothetical protein